MYNQILSLLNKVYRACNFSQMLANAISVVLTVIDGKITKTKNTFYFSDLDLDGILYWENLLDITPTLSQSLTDRKSSIQAKWYSNIHNDIILLQMICDAWKNGEAVVSFVNGKIRITFVGEYGVPADLDGLKARFEEVKPAHLPYETIFKYLLIRDIHEVKTLNKMEQLTISQFASEVE